MENDTPEYIWHENTELTKAIINTSEQEVLETFVQWLHITKLVKAFDQEKARLGKVLLTDLIKDIRKENKQ